MDTEQLKRICSQFPGAASHLYGHPNNILVYFIGDKKFAYFKTSPPKKWRYSIGVTPVRFVEVTDVLAIKPARYFARLHSVSSINSNSLSPDYLNELILWSYKKAMGWLSKVQQEKMLA